MVRFKVKPKRGMSNSSWVLQPNEGMERGRKEAGVKGE